ncbi:MAG: hypothetical protein ACKVPX_03030 [Myxococcaceae bacterium]
MPGFFFVSGTVQMPGPLPMTFSRAMTVVKEGERLVIVNSVRLNDTGLSALDRLGRVTDVIRIAGNHGMDDPFYKERYGATLWAPVGAPYIPGFNRKAEPYFEPDKRFDATTALPIAGAKVQMIASRPSEALLLLPALGGTLISGDALQNWDGADTYFNWLGRLTMRMMGFFTPHNVGPGWMAQCKPPAEDLQAMLGLSFENVLPAHGKPVIGSAKEKFRPAIEAAVKKRATAATPSA